MWKQRGVALSISDHLYQRVGGPLFLGERVGGYPFHTCKEEFFDESSVKRPILMSLLSPNAEKRLKMRKPSI
jgi:hypothetical protein